MSDSKPPPTAYFFDTSRDRWTEKLRCRHCGTAGSTELSTLDKLSLDIRVDGISEGFKAIAFACGSEFFCSMCDGPAGH